MKDFEPRSCSPPTIHPSTLTGPCPPGEFVFWSSSLAHAEPSSPLGGKFMQLREFSRIPCAVVVRNPHETSGTETAESQRLRIKTQARPLEFAPIVWTPHAQRGRMIGVPPAPEIGCVGYRGCGLAVLFLSLRCSSQIFDPLQETLSPARAAAKSAIGEIRTIDSVERRPIKRNVSIFWGTLLPCVIHCQLCIFRLMT